MVARTTAETVMKRAVTTSGGEDIAPGRTRRTPASAAPLPDLSRDPRGKRVVIVPVTALAPIFFSETTDVAVTDVKEKKNRIARQNSHLQPDQLHRYNLLHPLSKDHSITPDLPRNPRGKRGVIVPVTALAPIFFSETTDVAVTDVEEKKTGLLVRNRTSRPINCTGTSLGTKRTRARKILHALVRGFIPPQSEGRRKSLMLRVPRHERSDEFSNDPFDIADGNSQMNLVNYTASLKEAVAQIRNLGEDFSEDYFWIPGWHKPLMRYVLNSVSHHYPAQVTRTKQMVCDAFARAEAEERRDQPGNKFWREFYAPCAWDSALPHRIKHCSSCRPSKFLRKLRSRIFCLSYALQ